MTSLLLLLSVLLWVPDLCALQPRFFRHKSSSTTGNHLKKELVSSSPSLPPPNTRSPFGWRRVLSFGGIGNGGGITQSHTQYSNDRYFLSAVPNDASMNNETTASSSSTASSADSLRQEAEEWRRRAQEILEEVQSMEAELQETRSSSQQKREEATIDLTERMFRNRPLTPEACAQVMRDEKWAQEEAQMVLDGLFAQAYSAMGVEIASRASAPPAVASSTATPAAARSTATDADDTKKDSATPVQVFNATETLLLEAKMDCLINAADILDEIAMASKESVRRWPGRVGSALRARRNELRRAHDQNLARQIAVYQGVQSSASAPTSTAVNVSSSTDSTHLAVGFMEDQGQWPSRPATNSSRSSEQLPMVPMWVPSTLLEFLAASPSRIDPSDITTFKEKVLSGTAFFCTSLDSIAKAAIFRGNIRGVASSDRNATANVLDSIQNRLRDEGLAERLQIFLMPDPEWRPNRDQTVPQEPPKPVILAIPADVAPDERRLPKKRSFTGRALKTVAFIFPMLTTLVYSISCYALNPNFFEAVMQQRNPAIMSTCLPIFVGIFVVQAIHELAHVVVARRRGIKIGLPFPLPSLQFGSFGCITPLRSFPKDRAALLDFSLSGPLSAMLLSIVMMIAGIRLTVRASALDIMRFPVLPIYVLKSSFLAGSLLTMLAPKSMILPLSQPLPLHPMFMVGFAGLTSSALNMLPVFRLDGGRACSAAMGSRFCAVCSSGTLVFMFSLALSSKTGVAVAWGMLILLFQRKFEIPVRDELTDVDDVRLTSWIGALATAILALAPFPGGSCLM